MNQFFFFGWKKKFDRVVSINERNITLSPPVPDADIVYRFAKAKWPQGFDLILLLFLLLFFFLFSSDTKGSLQDRLIVSVERKLLIK